MLRRRPRDLLHRHRPGRRNQLHVPGDGDQRRRLRPRLSALQRRDARARRPDDRAAHHPADPLPVRDDRGHHAADGSGDRAVRSAFLDGGRVVQPRIRPGGGVPGRWHRGHDPRSGPPRGLRGRRRCRRRRRSRDGAGRRAGAGLGLDDHGPLHPGRARRRTGRRPWSVLPGRVVAGPSRRRRAHHRRARPGQLGTGRLQGHRVRRRGRQASPASVRAIRWTRLRRPTRPRSRPARPPAARRLSRAPRPAGPRRR